MTQKARRVGVYVCHCGGNISDYVDVDQVVAAAQGEPGVVVARQMTFACSDAGQQDMERDIAEQELDGLVVASCSPKLHVTTFRGVAKRAGLNPYEYTQVNVREQASWIHSDDAQGTTDKAIHLVKAGIARTLLTEPLEPVVVETTPRTLVIGGGVAGLRAAIGLADIGIGVVLIEREAELGGWVGSFGALYPNGKDGRKLVASSPTPSHSVPPSASSHRPRWSARPARSATTRWASGSAVRSPRSWPSRSAPSWSPPASTPIRRRSASTATASMGSSRCPSSSGSSTPGMVPCRMRGGECAASPTCIASATDSPEHGEYCSRYCCSATVAASVQLATRDRDSPPVPPLPRHAHVRQVRDDVHRVSQARIGLRQVRLTTPRRPSPPR